MKLFIKLLFVSCMFSSSLFAQTINFWEKVNDENRFSVLVELIEVADRVAMFDQIFGYGSTFFAPINTAFDQLPSDEMLELLSNPDYAKKFVDGLFIPRRWNSERLIAKASGDPDYELINLVSKAGTRIVASSQSNDSITIDGVDLHHSTLDTFELNEGRNVIHAIEVLLPIID